MRRPTTREPVDWTDVRRRLAEAQRGAALAAGEHDERDREVMLARAAELARPREETTDGTRRQMLAFVAGDERYLIDVSRVREVVQLDEVTVVPGAPSFVVGLVNLRGEVVCVMDPATILGRPSSRTRTAGSVVALGRSAPELALIVDQLDGVRELREGDLIPAPGGNDVRVAAVTRDAMTVLDADAVLDDGRLYVDESG